MIDFISILIGQIELIIKVKNSNVILSHHA